MTKSQPCILPMAEQNKAVTNRGGKETHPHVGSSTTPRLRSWCERGGQLKRGKHISQICLPSASASGPPRAARGAPALTRWVPKCCRPGYTSLAAQRRRLLALLTGIAKSVSCVKRKAEEEGGEQAMSELRAPLQKVFPFPDNVALFADFSLYRLFHISIFIPEVFPVAV